ncbi:MAG: 6-carboxytetrahydropterin synthase QueD [Candidatus Brocadia sp.]|jgi:queuosine biosynthesis protein QueD|uniref:6-carboxy-5,6,7,8-tetrahydropterin synthase n=1 Tax=Candidatus Brocadia fulgida TaxID=380242 RepID=A0A0M2USA8_9BACT|nr:MAG: putative 6-pyruvoyl-tetrahydropterin synthase [Candidatus Brocadia fulgida]MCC6325684.1 6-carboxytetrahydropterin synthase QueD [Candidatus Brocadia sp.]MCE7912205.1 6-carboxytetrahydropterin synthase QueD [Candidatus Brocadia sp. AMX3]OQY99055.1 MAG: 6-carboxytetrahydropterin synthase QueD [Candidatus Brocadia sp. UTAMX2]MBV6518166.1 6-carboxy-5,6,7,8-tetrahydropterin synthase [Candidatus Brocadia fulgida]
MFELIIETDFSAAHNLREYKGQCERLHGHNWKVQVILKAEKLDTLGMVMDFRDAKRVVGEIINRFDHIYLNELADFAEVNPTTENLSKILYEELRRELPAGVKVEKVTTWESDRCGASYFE